MKSLGRSTGIDVVMGFLLVLMILAPAFGAKSETSEPAEAIETIEQVETEADANVTIPANQTEAVKLLHAASIDGNVPQLKAIISSFPAAITEKSKESWTPLHLAAYNKQSDAVAVLVEAGADVDAVDEHEHTPLHHCAFFGLLDCVTVLIDAGASVNAQYWNGNTALHAAAYKGHKNVVQFLLKSGASVHIGNSDMQTPLQFSAYFGHPEVLQVLLDAGADPNIQSGTDFRTVMHWTALSESQDTLEALKVLLKNGVRANGRDMKNRFPFEVSSDDAKKELLTPRYHLVHVNQWDNTDVLDLVEYSAWKISEKDLLEAQDAISRSEITGQNLDAVACKYSSIEEDRFLTDIGVSNQMLRQSFWELYHSERGWIWKIKWRVMNLWNRISEFGTGKKEDL